MALHELLLRYYLTKPSGFYDAQADRSIVECDRCHRPLGGRPLRCSLCRLAFYCSEECAGERAGHEESCRAACSGVVRALLEELREAVVWSTTPAAVPERRIGVKEHLTAFCTEGIAVTVVRRIRARPEGGLEVECWLRQSAALFRDPAPLAWEERVRRLFLGNGLRGDEGVFFVDLVSFGNKTALYGHVLPFDRSKTSPLATAYIEEIYSHVSDFCRLSFTANGETSLARLSESEQDVAFATSPGFPFSDLRIAVFTDKSSNCPLFIDLCAWCQEPLLPHEPFMRFNCRYGCLRSAHPACFLAKRRLCSCGNAPTESSILSSNALG